MQNAKRKILRREARHMIDRSIAVRRLTARWHEQREMFPSFVNPLQIYIRRNLRDVMRGGLLASYDGE